MAVSATAVVDCHRVISGMARTNAGWFVTNDRKACCRVINGGMGSRSTLGVVAVQAMDSPCVVRNDELDSCADRDVLIDISDRIVAGGAESCMGTQDVLPVQNRVAVGAGLHINLT